MEKIDTFVVKRELTNNYDELMREYKKGCMLKRLIVQYPFLNIIEGAYGVLNIKIIGVGGDHIVVPKEGSGEVHLSNHKHQQVYKSNGEYDIFYISFPCGAYTFGNEVLYSSISPMLNNFLSGWYEKCIDYDALNHNLIIGENNINEFVNELKDFTKDIREQSQQMLKEIKIKKLEDELSKLKDSQD